MTSREEMKKECLRCGYVWLARIEGRPVQCPACKNLKWDEKPKQETSK